MCQYLTKISDMRLEGAASTMLPDMDHIQEVKSRSTDARTELRFFFLSQRTINPFQGGSEHEIGTMIAALLEMKSHVSNIIFHYSFINNLVCFIDKLIKSTNEKESCECTGSSSYSFEISDTEVEDVLNLDDCDKKIEEIEK